MSIFAMAINLSKRNSIMNNELTINSEDVCVVDVYDLATEIMGGLIPKMVNALEILEGLAHRNERENCVIQEFQDRIRQLENEKLEKAEYRKRFEKVSEHKIGGVKSKI
jgi:hypothetical protein